MSKRLFVPRSKLSSMESMDTSDLTKSASRQRQLGNELYALGRCETALKCYTKAIAAIRNIDDSGRGQKAKPLLDKSEKKQLLFPLFLNSAA